MENIHGKEGVQMEIKVNFEDLERFSERIKHSRGEADDALQRLSWESTNLHFLSVANVESILNLQEEIQQIIGKIESLTESAYTLVSETAEKLKEADELSGGWTEFWSNVWDGATTGVKDTWEGVKSISEWETFETMRAEITHPLETLDMMWSSLSNSWDEKVAHGDLHTRTEFFTYGVIQMGLSILGGKGIQKTEEGKNVAQHSDFAGNE
ncbi:hypothetical protein P4561_14115 [Priestia flexa]|uniref:hypothetical protein n=2 Tax=Priestia flexa TaxID=86664 RepID=UPI002E1F7A5D|nr:hypothetical protein [Priestia flexa]